MDSPHMTCKQKLLASCPKQQLNAIQDNNANKVRGIKENNKPKIHKAEQVSWETWKIEKRYFVDEMFMFYYGRQISLEKTKRRTLVIY